MLVGSKNAKAPVKRGLRIEGSCPPRGRRGRTADARGAIGKCPGATLFQIEPQILEAAHVAVPHFREGDDVKR